MPKALRMVRTPRGRCVRGAGTPRLPVDWARMDDSLISRGNLFATPVPSSGERFDELARFGNTTIERIVSSAEPGADPYDQAQDEWVVLLAGHAQLEVAGRPVDLGPGDHVSLPAHTPHRVLSTSAGTVWLAVHVTR